MKIFIAVALLLPLFACTLPKRLDLQPPAAPISQPAAPAPATPPAAAQPAPETPAPSAAAPTPVVQPAPSPPNEEDVRLAAAELQKIANYTGLTDGQVARENEAEALLVRSENQKALEILRALSAELASAQHPYTVGRGDSLWKISGRPQVYNNPTLWPLIYDANRDRIPDPGKLQIGQVLRIRPHPTIEEVVQAVERAQRYARGQVEIGEVKRVPEE